MMSFFNWFSKNSGNQDKTNQKINNKQKLIQDQNYSTQMFYGMMSTLESIVRFYQNTNQSHFDNKMFKAYDRVDYRSKSLLELKSQLKTQIFLNQASRMVFAQENPNQDWKLPKNFDPSQVKAFLDNSLALFDTLDDKESFYMTKDIYSILGGNLKNLNAEKMDFELNYSQEDKKQFKNSLVSNGIFSTQQMDQREKEAKNYQDVNDINAKVNQHSNPFKEVMKGNQPSKHQPTQIYLVYRPQKDNVIKKMIQNCYNYENPLDLNKCKQQDILNFQSYEQITKNAKNLKAQGYSCIICIRFDQKLKIMEYKQLNEIRIN